MVCCLNLESLTLYNNIEYTQGIDIYIYMNKKKTHQDLDKSKMVHFFQNNTSRRVPFFLNVV